MRIHNIRLSWFRGASESAELRTGGRSIVVYGPNGAGKSSFVDGVEYVLRGGRVRHLAHEYSGRNQEKAILNTHRPEDATGGVSITLSGKAEISCTIGPSGACEIHAENDPGFLESDAARLVLRQDEVSEFIHATKGEKYSALLPLLGLEHLEIAAENLRALARAIHRRSGASVAETERRQALRQLSTAYEGSAPATADAALHALCETYVDEAHEHAPSRCAELTKQEIETRLANISALERERLDVGALGLLDVQGDIGRIRSARGALAKVSERAIQHRLDALHAAEKYLVGEDPSGRTACPSCGTELLTKEFAAHVKSEVDRLKDVRTLQEDLRAHTRSLQSTVTRAVELCRGDAVKRWAVVTPEVVATIEEAAAYELTDTDFSEDTLLQIEQHLVPALLAAASSVFGSSPAEDLADAQVRLTAASNLHEADLTLAAAKGALQLVDLVESQEARVREQIHTHTSEVINDISEDIQRMWSTLHPSEPIEDVRLHVPEDTDKAIDLALKFYGKSLPSPRLTLSEGYRNSLGLCVFLAMAARNPVGERPMILDDVIVSLDRGHRGMVVEILQEEFANRQIIIFTHDRDWFADLRHQLGEGAWQFRSLLPYSSPPEGIRWAHRTGGLADARGYLESRPDTAANEARKVMDVETAIVVERLGLQLPFARGLRNDRRTCQEFLERLIAEGKTRLQVRNTENNYEANEPGVAALKAAETLLVTWANRGSHSRDVTKDEAEKLIVACERALEALVCSACQKPVTYAEAKNGNFQCECSVLRWKA